MVSTCEEEDAIAKKDVEVEDVLNTHCM